MHPGYLIGYQQKTAGLPAFPVPAAAAAPAAGGSGFLGDLAGPAAYYAAPMLNKGMTPEQQAAVERADFTESTQAGLPNSKYNALSEGLIAQNEAAADSRNTGEFVRESLFPEFTLAENFLPNTEKSMNAFQMGRFVGWPMARHYLGTLAPKAMSAGSKSLAPLRVGAAIPGAVKAYADAVTSDKDISRAYAGDQLPPDSRDILGLDILRGPNLKPISRAYMNMPQDSDWGANTLANAAYEGLGYYKDPVALQDRENLYEARAQHVVKSQDPVGDAEALRRQAASPASQEVLGAYAKELRKPLNPMNPTGDAVRRLQIADRLGKQYQLEHKDEIEKAKEVEQQLREAFTTGKLPPMYKDVISREAAKQRAVLEQQQAAVEAAIQEKVRALQAREAALLKREAGVTVPQVPVAPPPTQAREMHNEGRSPGLPVPEAAQKQDLMQFLQDRMRSILRDKNGSAAPAYLQGYLSKAAGSEADRLREQEEEYLSNPEKAPRYVKMPKRKAAEAPKTPEKDKPVVIAENYQEPINQGK